MGGSVTYYVLSAWFEADSLTELNQAWATHAPVQSSRATRAISNYMMDRAVLLSDAEKALDRIARHWIGISSQGTRGWNFLSALGIYLPDEKNDPSGHIPSPPFRRFRASLSIVTDTAQAFESLLSEVPTMIPDCITRAGADHSGERTLSKLITNSRGTVTLTITEQFGQTHERFIKALHDAMYSPVKK